MKPSLLKKVKVGSDPPFGQRLRQPSPLSRVGLLETGYEHVLSEKLKKLKVKKSKKVKYVNKDIKRETEIGLQAFGKSHCCSEAMSETAIGISPLFR